MYGCGTLYNVHGTHRGKRRLKRLLIILESYQNFQIGCKTGGEGEEGGSLYCTTVYCMCPAAGEQGFFFNCFID
jgi:hypothetical protein